MRQPPETVSDLINEWKAAADRSLPSFLSPVPVGSGSAAPFGSQGVVFPLLLHWLLPLPGPRQTDVEMRQIHFKIWNILFLNSRTDALINKSREKVSISFLHC